MNYKQIAVDFERIMRIGKKLMSVLRKKTKSPLSAHAFSSECQCALFQFSLRVEYRVLTYEFNHYLFNLAPELSILHHYIGKRLCRWWSEPKVVLLVSIHPSHKILGLSDPYRPIQCIVKDVYARDFVFANVLFPIFYGKRTKILEISGIFSFFNVPPQVFR